MELGVETSVNTDSIVLVALALAMAGVVVVIVAQLARK